MSGGVSVRGVSVRGVSVQGVSVQGWGVGGGVVVLSCHQLTLVRPV